jgi:hypothetical protein
MRISAQFRYYCNLAANLTAFEQFSVPVRK